MADPGLTDWCNKNGITFNGIVAGYVSEGWRGIVATKDLEPGEVVLRVPERLLLTTRSAARDPQLSAALQRHKAPQAGAAEGGSNGGGGAQCLSPFQLLACHLLLEVSRGPDSFWWPYLRQLPRSYTSLANFGPEDAAALQLQHARDAAAAAAERAREEWRGALPVLQELGLPKRFTAFRSWLWAAATLHSRTMYLPWCPAGALTPYGDLHNYQPPPAPYTPELGAPAAAVAAEPGGQSRLGTAASPSAPQVPDVAPPAAHAAAAEAEAAGVTAVVAFDVHEHLEPLPAAAVDNGERRIQSLPSQPPGTRGSGDVGGASCARDSEGRSCSFSEGCCPSGAHPRTETEAVSTVAISSDATFTLGGEAGAEADGGASAGNSPACQQPSTALADVAVSCDAAGLQDDHCCGSGIPGGNFQGGEAGAVDDGLGGPPPHAGGEGVGEGVGEAPANDGDGSAIAGDGMWDEAAQQYCIVVRRPYRRAEQVMLCYGRYTNLELLEHYGFVLQDNPHDTAKLDPALLPLPSAARAAAGAPYLSPDDCFLHANGQPSWQLLHLLRYCAASPAERRSAGHLMAAGERASDQGDCQALRWLHAACIQQLEELPTSLRQDTEAQRLHAEEHRSQLLQQQADKGHDRAGRAEEGPSRAGTGAAAPGRDAAAPTLAALSDGLTCAGLALQWRMQQKRILAAAVRCAEEVMGHAAPGVAASGRAQAPPPDLNALVQQQRQRLTGPSVWGRQGS